MYRQSEKMLNNVKQQHLLAIQPSRLQGCSNKISCQLSSTYPDNMVNFGPLMAEIGSGVSATPANFNGFRVLTALLHGTLVVGVSQTLRH